MNTRKTLAGIGLAAAALSFYSAAPARAQFGHPIRTQRHQAARLDRQAAHAAYNGNYRRAVRLRRHAARLRTDARHGY